MDNLRDPDMTLTLNLVDNHHHRVQRIRADKIDDKMNMSLQNAV